LRLSAATTTTTTTTTMREIRATITKTATITTTTRTTTTQAGSESFNLIDAKNIQTYARIALQLSLAACGRQLCSASTVNASGKLTCNPVAHSYIHILKKFYLL